jgi:flavin-dependent dehydrogenase
VKATGEEVEAFTVETRSAHFQARALIDATGRWSRLRNDTVPSGPKWIGLKCHYADRDFGLSNPSVDLYFFDGGYCGVQPIAQGVVNACAMVRSDRATTLREAFALHPRLRERAQRWTPVFDAISTAPLVFRDPQPLRWVSHRDSEKREATNEKPVLCVGDAAAFIDPFAGDGISLALRTGAAAGESLIAFAHASTSLAEAARRYAQRYTREFAPILRSASRVRRLLSLPRPLRAAGLSAMRIPGIADRVIRSTRAAR